MVDYYEGLDRAAIVARDPAGVPLYEHSISDVQKVQYTPRSPSARLDSDRTWFFVTPAYVFIQGLDIPLFELFGYARNKPVDVVRLNFKEPLFHLSGFDVRGNPAFGALFGIPEEDSRPFIDFIATYEIRGEKHAWAIDWQKIRIADPCVEGGPVIRTDCWVALPRYLSVSRKLAVVDDGGLFCSTPVLGVVKGDEGVRVQ